MSLVVPSYVLLSARNVGLFVHGEGFKNVWTTTAVNRKLNEIYDILTTEKGELGRSCVSTSVLRLRMP